MKSDVSQDPFPTSARVIKTSPNPDTGREQYVEVNKNPLASDNAEVNRKDNQTEGDPDYFSDASRMVIAHSADVDTNFNISKIKLKTGWHPKTRLRSGLAKTLGLWT